MADSVNRAEPAPKPSQTTKQPEELKKRGTPPSRVPAIIVSVVIAAAIRAYPVEKVPELRPGMSAYLDWRARG